LYIVFAQYELPTLVSLKTPIKDASAGNRTRAARVAGEHSTTEPPMRLMVLKMLTSFLTFDDLLDYRYKNSILEQI
jgi:hypothetical protein